MAQYFSIIFFIHLAPHLPLWMTDVIGRILGKLMRLSDNSLYRSSKTNLRLTQNELNNTEIDSLASQSLSRTISNFFEMPLIWAASDQWIKKKIIKIDGEDTLLAALEQKAGVILVIPHIGNWEILGRHSSHYAPMTSLYKQQKNPALESFIKQGREASGSTLVPTNAKGVGGLLKALRRNELTAILPDHVPAKNSGIFAPFFGQPAYTMTLVHQLIKRTQCKVVVGYAIRVKQGFELSYEAPETAIYDAEEKVSVAALNQSIEKVIDRHMSQYQWGYKRFKKRPEGMATPYA